MELSLKNPWYWNELSKDIDVPIVKIGCEQKPKLTATAATPCVFQSLVHCPKAAAIGNDDGKIGVELLKLKPRIVPFSVEKMN